MSNAPTKRVSSLDDGAVFDPKAPRITRKRKGTERVTLRTVRQGMGFTQVEVAKALGTEQSEVSRIERRVYLETLRKYAAALGMELDVALVMKDGRRFRIADPEPE